MQKGVPGAVSQLDEAKSSFRLEPFDNGTNRRSGGGLEPGWVKARRRSAAKFPEMRVVAVILEVAASGLTKIPVSNQVSFLSNRFTAPTETAEVDCSKKSRRARAE